ncbi:MAG: AMP-binding protein [Planctomycetota bacterium]|nr:AMP-binding protein [Planctomycetota bacterium]
MSGAETASPLSIRAFFAGKSVLVTGATGFLAKALVEKLLRDLPEIRRIHLLIRPRVRPDGSLVDPQIRLREEILRNSVFHRLREEWGERFDRVCEEKLACVPGDLGRERLGLEPGAYAELAARTDLVIGSAATVVFDERLDVALEVNTLSPQRLLEFARLAGAAYAHISTCYVCGQRVGSVPERLLEPLEAIDAQLAPGVPRPQAFEVEREVEKLRTLTHITQADAETEARKRGWAPESDEARSYLRRALVGAGMKRARSLGWNDTYTYTKWLGEQLIRLRHGEVSTAIVRTSIIESSLREPEPGWLDGLRMADPLIVGFGKGRLRDFPASRDMVLDVIPADMAVNGVLAAAAAAGQRKGAFELIHVASSDENPLVFETLYQSVRDYFKKHPFLDRRGRPVRVPAWKFPSVESFRRRVTYGYLHPMKAIGALMDVPVPMPGARKLRNRLRVLHGKFEQLLYYVDIYSPYTNQKVRFETRRARTLLERLAPEDRETFDFDVRRIRWRHYLQEVHIPGLKRNILRMDEPPRAGAGEGRLLEEEAEAQRARASAAAHGVPQTIVELAARAADRFGARTFLEIQRAKDGVARLSFAELFERSEALARKLRARLGLEPGDRVVLWAENGPEWALSYLAIVRAGATAVPLDRQLPPDEAANVARLVEAKALVVSASILKKAGEAWPGEGAPVPLDPRADLEPHAGRAWPFPHAEDGRPLKDPKPESLASILFTSGTTLHPKGVMLSHLNFVSNALSVAEVLEPLESDRFLSLLPLHHAFEFTGGLLTPLFGGSTIHYLESLRREEILETMQRVGATVLLGVPRIFQLFADGIRERVQQAGPTGRMALAFLRGAAMAAEAVGGENARKTLFRRVHDSFGGKVRLFVSGGAALNPEVFEFFKRFGIPVAEGYGLTETAPILSVNPLGAPKSGSVGLPLPGVELRLRQPDLRGVGEVLARGPSVMLGYWRDPESTERAFEDGWFRTGDLGRVDADGYLFLTGRLRDTIVTGAGKNVYPDELEARFRGLAGTREVCVLGLPARSGHGEEVALVAVLEPGGSADAVRQAVEKLNAELPSHQRVARVEVQEDELPKTATLKVQRRALQERYRGERPAAKKAPSFGGARGDAFTEVARAIAEVAQLDPADVTPEKRLQLDLGLDSIGRVDLMGKLELRLNVTILDEQLVKMMTVAEVVEAVEAARRSEQGAADGSALAERIWRRKVEALSSKQAFDPTFSRLLLGGALSTTAKVLFNTWLSIECYGLENLPERGAYVLAANHASHLDTAAIRQVLGRRSSDLHVMGARDYFFDTRLKSWFFSSAFNVLPFEREENTLDGLAVCRQALERGRALLIFPEGTRSVSGKLQPFKSGIGMLALELDYPVIPVHVKGTHEALPKGRSIPRRARVRVRFGAPLPFEELRGRRQELESQAEKPRKGAGSAARLYREAAQALRAAVEQLAQAP